MTLAAAQAGDGRAFGELVDGHRRELAAHCYRMLASVDDAEEALQETLLAAWRGLPGFEGRSSLRTWLYRIATTVSLRMAQRRPARVLSWDHLPARGPADDLGEPVVDPVFVDPWWADPRDPAAAYERRESIELAYVAALQQLPPNQRAVLILREVLGFPAADVAGILETSVASVNSALQRARATLATRLDEPERTAAAEERAVVDAFVSAFERRDIDALVGLLTADVRFTMPPLPAWFAGRADVGRFYAERVFATPWRQVVLADVNGRPALLGYQQQGGVLRPGALQVLSFRAGRISWIASFLDPAMIDRLRAERSLPAELRPDR